MHGFRWTFPDKRQLPLARSELARAHTLGLGGELVESTRGFILVVRLDPTRADVYQEWSWGSSLRFPRSDG